MKIKPHGQLRHKSWRILGTKNLLVIKNRLTVCVQKVKLPEGEIIDNYYQVYFPDSVIMVARTEKNSIVMVRHYSHGFGKVSTMLPGGTIFAGESPLKTAKRELYEETGYVSSNWKAMGNFYVHPNQRCGKVYFFFADNSKKISEPDSHDLEEMEILLMTEREIIEDIRKKKIISLGTITALTLAKLFF